MSSNRFFEGLFFGGLAGFLVGLLYAPKPGSQLRKEIVDTSDELYKQASSQLSDLKDRTDAALQDLQTKSDAVIKQATAQVQETRDQLASKLQDMTSSPKVSLKDSEYTN
jgi:gas vesicle protein